MAINGYHSRLTKQLQDAQRKCWKDKTRINAEIKKCELRQKDLLALRVANNVRLDDIKTALAHYRGKVYHK